MVTSGILHDILRLVNQNVPSVPETLASARPAQGRVSRTILSAEWTLTSVHAAPISVQRTVQSVRCTLAMFKLALASG